MNFNKLILGGNLTRDPQTQERGGVMVCEFGIAVNRKGKQGDEILFLECVAFGKTAEVMNQYLSKGKPVLVEGRLKFDQWQDRETGANRSKHTMVVERFEFVGGREQSDGGGYGEQQAYAEQRAHDAGPAPREAAPAQTYRGPPPPPPPAGTADSTPF